MGLDATVYRRGHGPDDDDCADHEAISRRLGNIAEVAFIRDRVSELLPADSVLLRVVLYSGSQAGDEIAAALVPTLMAELQPLLRGSDLAAREFAQIMAEVAEAALRQRNPICF